RQAGPVTGPSVLVERLATAGAPPTVLIGVRNAVERRSAGTTVPAGTALLGTVLAVLGLCATGVFSASLSHLTATPRLYGTAFQLDFSNPNGGPPDPALVRRLGQDPAVSAVTRGYAVEVAVDGLPVGALAGTPVRGALLIPVIDGHDPTGDSQIGLGTTTMRAIGAHIGSVVRVSLTTPSGQRRTAPFTVVARMSFPVLGGATSLGNGAAMTLDGYEHAACAAGPGRPRCESEVLGSAPTGGLLASVVPGPRGRAAVQHYLDAYQAITTLPVTPTSLVNFGEAVNFPLIFGVLLAVFGAGTLTHLLVVSLARRRREIGLLKALGFLSRQAAWAVSWQATTLAVLGLVVGVPLGIVIGRAVWSTFADNLGVLAVPVVPVWLPTLAVAVVVAANLIAVVPALAAGRARPQALLRTQ
ncbi:MAG TPA: FtsX-like permease family protein, partial [Acidimicrobiales bacterium]|nr:FtsX-like permease family protein [Acidimicrobiales bacterium]